MSRNSSEISWTGEFIDPALERAVAETTAPQALVLARLCIIATTVTSLGFAPLDVLTLPHDLLPFFLGDRLVIALVCLGALAAFLRFRNYRQITTITYTQQYAFFVLNALIFNHPVLVRHGGALLPLIALSLFMYLPGSFRAAAALCAFAPAISLYFWGVARPHPETPRDIAMIALMTLVAYVVGGVARSRFNRMRREEYLHIERERHVNQTLLEAKEAAEAGSRAKADFLAVMSHEIRTPMNGVLGMVRLVLDSKLAPQDHQRLETACQSAEGLLTILDDILDISKLESGHTTFESTPFALLQAFEGVATLMGARAREKGLAFTLDLDSALPEWVCGDCARLRQVLFNLTGNAVKFTEAGEVRLKATAQPGGDGLVRVDIAVSDTGIGIDPELHDRLFQAFTQADATISRRFGGTGLGLVICKKLIDGMGGSIDFDSMPGKGSRFRVSLFFTPAQPVRSAPVPELGLATPLSVLLAEDNPVNREVAKAYLLKAGHRVTMAANGAQAVEHAAKGGFDLILMDMRMPEVDGLEATRRIRALSGPRGNVPIIALTANAMHADVVRCRAAGMNGHLAKPMTLSGLTAAIAQVLEHGGEAPLYCFDVLLMGKDDAAIGERIKSLGHRLFAAASAEAGLAMASARPFDLVILSGPDIPALEAVRRAVALQRQAPAILAVAAADQESLAGLAGADEILPLRADDDDLVRAISRHLPTGNPSGPERQGELIRVLGAERTQHLRALLHESLRHETEALSVNEMSAKALDHIAHRIKGSAANLGGTALARAADAAMRVAKDPAACPEATEKARHELRAAIEAFILNSSDSIAIDR